MLELYTDGSSTGRVGAGGWAFVLLDNGLVVKESSGGADDTTNNRMELAGIIEGLQYICRSSYPLNSNIIVYSDSQYAVKGITEWYSSWEQKIENGKTIKNQDLWTDFKELSDLFSCIEFIHIRGHSEIEYNERCDCLAKQAKANVQNAGQLSEGSVRRS